MMMSDLPLPPPADLTVFLSAALLLGLTPGPDMLLVVNRSLGHGFRRALITMAGILTGCAAHTLAAAFGITLLIMQVPHAYDVLRYAGAGYLVFLGVQMIRSGGGVSLTGAGRMAPGAATLFHQALLTNLLNPKVALFILAFLPQFVPAGAPDAALRIIILGGLFFGIGLAVMGIMAALADRIRHILLNRPGLLRGQSVLTGLLMLVFAAGLVFSGPPGARQAS